MPKRELKTININFAIEPSFNKRLLEQAEREGRSLSNFIRFALERYLQEVSATEKPKPRRR